MKKIIIGGILGGIVYFIWGALSWMVFPWHNATISRFANDDAVMDALRQQVTESGAYYFPNMPENCEDPVASDAFAAKHKKGPLGFLIFHAGGQDMKMGPSMARGLAIDVASALILAYLLTLKAPGSYGCRVTFVLLIGLFTSLTTHGMYWNWMLFPCDYTMAMFADVIGGWTLAGLVMAAIVKPRSAIAATGTLPGVIEPG